jgi:hypothetical protein
MAQQVVIIKGKKFLIHSILKLSTKYNILGFWETPKGWSAHVDAVELSHQEWEQITSAL